MRHAVCGAKVAFSFRAFAILLKGQPAFDWNGMETHAQKYRIESQNCSWALKIMRQRSKLRVVHANCRFWLQMDSGEDGTRGTEGSAAGLQICFQWKLHQTQRQTQDPGVGSGIMFGMLRSVQDLVWKVHPDLVFRVRRDQTFSLHLWGHLHVKGLAFFGQKR